MPGKMHRTPAPHADSSTGGLAVCCFVLLLLSGKPLQGQAPSPLQAGASLKGGVQALFAGDHLKAQNTAKRLLAANPRSVEALILLARAQMAQGNYAPAFESLRKALGYSPDNIEALFFMGKLSSALSQMEYQRLARLDPDSGRTHQLMGDSYQAAGNMDKAQEEYKAALAVQPDLRDAGLELAELLRTQGRFEEALKYYLQILDRNPRHYPSLCGAGLCYQALQDDDHALEFFERAAEADPGDAVSRYLIGSAFLRKKEPRKAIDALTAAVHLDPSLQGAYTLLGRAFLMTGQRELAEQAFEKAKQLLRQALQSREERVKKAIDVPNKN
jgi:tetratricopeptide (TPR) repeat protein